MPQTTKVLFTTSTMPSSDTDPVPAFVRDEAIWMKRLYPNLDITVLAPHNAYSPIQSYAVHEYYDEYRFHYFWPFRFEKLTGKGIQPALKKHKWLYIELPGLFIAEFFATWKLLRREKYDAVYAHWFTPQAITAALAAKLTRTPLVFDTQASDAIVLKKVPFAHRFVVGICRQAVAYTAPSQQTLDKLLYFTNDTNRDQVLSKLTMVPYGTSVPNIDQKDIDSVVEKYGLENKKVLYFIGRLVDRKGIDFLIKSFARLYEADSSLCLVIVGDGQMKDELVTLAKSLGVENAIRFTGFLTGTERYGLLGAADVCVIPSVNVGDQSEGLPVVFMEAATIGKPVVLSDATGAHEVASDGKDAFIVEAGNVESLTDGIDRALKLIGGKSEEREIFTHNVRILGKTFQWESIAKRRYDALILPTKQTV